MLDQLNADHFRPHLGATYRLTSTDTGEAFDATLANVAEGEAIPDVGADRAPFDIVLLAPMETLHPQGTYRVEHEGDDAIDGVLFVPIGPDEAGIGMQYHAVFG